MTKDEFLSMLNEELENLDQEYKTTSQKVEYFRTINSSGKELRETEYQLQALAQKNYTLGELVTLPAYARVQVMSDIEIGEYKKEKVEELELKIKEIESKEKQETAKLSQLKSEQEQLIIQCGGLTGNERDRAIYRGQQLSEEISRYDINNQYGVFASLKKEKEEIRKQQELIKNMSSQEIKQQLSQKIKNSYTLAQRVEWTKNPIDEFIELQASVAADPEKAQQMANLLTAYKQLSNEQQKISGKLYLGYGLPKSLEKDLTKYSYNYDSSTNEVFKPDKLMEIVQEFVGLFEQAKANFNEQFTEQKLSKLVGKEYGIESSEVDIDFLKQHTDKLVDGELEHLQSLVEQRNKLLKKIFKTKDTKWEIENLNNKIKQEQSTIYGEIIGWYKSRSKDLLGITYGLNFVNLEILQDSLKSCKKDIDRSEQSINEVKEEIQKAKVEMEQKRQNYETKKTELAQRIRALGGEKYKETKISPSIDVKNNLSSIANAQRIVYEREIVNRVQQEAQKQADIREAELRGITLEQLLQMKQQAMGNEPIIENNEEEVSHGMKR